MVSNPVEPARKRKKSQKSQEQQDRDQRRDHLAEQTSDQLNDPLTASQEALSTVDTSEDTSVEGGQEQLQEQPEVQDEAPQVQEPESGQEEASDQEQDQESEQDQEQDTEQEQDSEQDTEKQGEGQESDKQGSDDVQGKEEPSGEQEKASGGGGGGSPDPGDKGKEGSGKGLDEGSTDGEVAKDESAVDTKGPIEEGGSDQEGGSLGGSDGGGGNGEGGGKGSSNLSAPGISTVSGTTIPDLGTGNPLLADPAMEKMLVSETGLSLQGHQSLLNQGSQELATAVQDANSIIASTGQSLQSTTLNFGQGLATTTTSLNASTTGNLGDVFSQVQSQVDSTATQALGTVGSEMGTAISQVQSVTAQQVSAETMAFAKAEGVLESAKATWEGDYTSTVMAHAEKVASMGAQLETKAKSLEAAHRANYKSLGASSNPENALELASEKAKADTYKRYAPEFKKYGDHAASYLKGMADKATDLTDKLLAPTLNSLYPLQQDNEQTMSSDGDKLQTQLTQEQQTFQTGMTEIRDTTTTAMETGREDAVSQVDSATSTLQSSTDESLNAVMETQTLATTQLQQTRASYMDVIQQASDNLPDTTDATEFEAGKQELLTFLDDSTTRVVQTLQDDTQRATQFVQERHTTQTQVIQDQSQQHAQRVLDSGQSSLMAISVAQDNTRTQLGTLMEQGNAVYSTLGQNTVAQANDSAQQIDTTSTEYRQKLLAQLDEYAQGAFAQMQDLQSKAMVAADSAGQTAKTTQAAALKKRAVEIYKAIDGWGTDESTLLKNMGGLTLAEARYTAARYKDEAGESLRDAIIGDTSEGDNVREAALAYLDGKQALGAKYALKYASEGIWRVFGADMDLVNHTMSNMDEDSRTELLNDPDFPAIKQNIENPTIAMGPESLLFGGGALWAGTAFFGPGKYDLDSFAALSDPSKTLEEAKKDVQVIELAKAFDTDSMNPFKWGTDEAKVWEIMGKLEGEELEEFKKKFEAYKGISLEDEIQDEFGGFWENDLEYKRAMALANGDKASADAYALELSLDKGKEQEVFKLLEDPNLVAANDGTSQDWLASRKAQSDREQLVDTYADQTGSTLSGDIDKELKDEGEHANDIAQDYLAGRNADPKELLAYAIIRGGTDEVYAQKAIEQLKADVAAAKAKDPEAGQAAWDEMCAWFKTNYNITDLEQYLGVGDGLYDDRLRELDGQERMDFNDVLMEIKGNPNSIYDQFARAQTKWEWYRKQNIVSNGVMDLYSDSGNDLDAKWTKLKELKGDTSWYDTKSGIPHDLTGKKYAEWQKYTELLDTMGGIYKDQRETLVNGITSVITTIAAVVSTIVTAGALGPLWVGIAIGAGAAAVNMMIKSTMKGSAYGPGEALTDFSMLAGEALIGMATAGIGPSKFKQFGKFLQELGEKGIKAKILAGVISSAPGELQGILMDEKTWTGDWDEFLATLGVSSFKLVVGSVGGVANESLASKVAEPGKKWVNAMGETITEIVSDPVVMSGDDLHLAILQKSLEKFAGAGGAEISIQAQVKKMNRLVSVGAGDLEHMSNITDDAAQDIYSRLKPEHQLSLHQDNPERFTKPDISTHTEVQDDKTVDDILDHAESGNNELDPEEIVKIVDPEVDENPPPVDQQGQELLDGKETAPELDDHKTETHNETDTHDGKTDTHEDGNDLHSDDKSIESIDESHREKSNDTKQDAVPGALTHLQDQALLGALQDIDRIGPVLSDRIVKEREANGPFKDAADLQKRVTGIGPILSERIIGNIKGRSELHNHQQGVFEVQDLVQLYGGEQGSVALLDHLEANLGKLQSAVTEATTAYNEAPEGPTKERLKLEMDKAQHTLETVTEKLALRKQVDQELSNDEILQELLNAGTLAYDQAYDVRKIITSMPPAGGAMGYYEVLLNRLAQQGISYIELTGAQVKLTPEQMRQLMDKTGVEIRYLKSVRSRNTLGNESTEEASTDIKKQMEKAFGEGSEGKHFVGIDYLGAEPGFTRAGMTAFEQTCLELSTQLQDGKRAVVRVHVGEGYFNEKMSQTERKAESKKAQDNVQALIESIVKVQAGLIEQGLPVDTLEIRAGHVTHASEEQIKKLVQLGVHMEVNLGSNLQTHTLQDLNQHPLLQMLYHDAQMSINTDAGGVMNTTLDEEYQRAKDIIDDFKDGLIKLKVDNKEVSFDELDSKTQARFSVEHLEQMSRDYQRIDRDN